VSCAGGLVGGQFGPVADEDSVQMTWTRILVVAIGLFVAQVVRAQPHGVSTRLVSEVSYTLSRRGAVSSVRFTLAPAAAHVRARISLRDRWHACEVAGTRVTCPLDVPAAALERLQVDV
jgi:hypothetical protein